MPLWKYYLAYDLTSEQLNDLGSRGWQVVGYSVDSIGSDNTSYYVLARPAPQKWEYRVLEHCDEAELMQLGEQGYELVTIHEGRCYCKKPKAYPTRASQASNPSGTIGDRVEALQESLNSFR